MADELKRHAYPTTGGRYLIRPVLGSAVVKSQPSGTTVWTGEVPVESVALTFTDSDTHFTVEGAPAS
jgi:hypothetical protein